MNDGIYMEVFAVKNNVRYNYTVLSLHEVTQAAAKGTVDGICEALGLKDENEKGK